MEPHLIAAHPARQDEGRGAASIGDVEAALEARGARILLVETSSQPRFARTRGFYGRAGFTEEARIRDFCDAGDDKVVFRKAFGAA